MAYIQTSDQSEASTVEGSTGHWFSRTCGGGKVGGGGGGGKGGVKKMGGLSRNVPPTKQDCKDLGG
jgi:hypothetical protein